MDSASFAKKPNRVFWLIVSNFLTPVIGVIDYLTGEEIAFSLFYVIPISMASWYVNRSYGVFNSIYAALIWLAADIASGHVVSNQGVYIWNCLTRFSFFYIITVLLSNLKKSYDHEKELARIDTLTKASNRRFFFEQIQNEIDRSQRNKKPFSVAYLDLDNFKSVNDKQGHDEGDKVLTSVVNTAKTVLRKIDVVGRLGGDEFSLLLPETSQEAAKTAIAKVQTSLLEEMKKNNWPVTFSIGVLTCANTKITSNELVKKADELMYLVKKNGKNSVSFQVLDESF